MNLDPLFLSRLQFAWVVAWHFLLPAFTVGLASFIAVLEGLHLATVREPMPKRSNGYAPPTLSSWMCSQRCR